MQIEEQNIEELEELQIQVIIKFLYRTRIRLVALGRNPSHRKVMSVRITPGTRPDDGMQTSRP